jgi:hypothetical protein
VYLWAFQNVTRQCICVHRPFMHTCTCRTRACLTPFLPRQRTYVQVTEILTELRLMQVAEEVALHDAGAAELARGQTAIEAAASARQREAERERLMQAQVEQEAANQAENARLDMESRRQQAAADQAESARQEMEARPQVAVDEVRGHHRHQRITYMQSMPCGDSK